MVQSDEELMIRVREDNDTKAFEVLVQRHKKSLLNFVCRFMGDRELAEDISQEVFLRLWTSAGTYLPIAKFSTFLYTIAKNLCLNALARSKSLPKMQSLSEIIPGKDADKDSQSQADPADPDGSPETKLINIEIESKIKEAVCKLSPEHRLVFILTEYHGLSYQDVASIVQCPVGTVASRKNAAVRSLRRYLAPLRE